MLEAREKADRINRALGLCRSVYSDWPARILFGSYASGCPNLASDIDILAIGTSTERRVQVLIDDFYVDLVREDLATVQRGLRRRHKNNNNIHLDILANGVVVGVCGKEELALIEEAKALFLQGPERQSTQMIDSEMLDSRAMFEAVRFEIERKGFSSAERIQLYRMRQDQILRSVVYLVFRSKRLWTTSFPRLIGQVRDKYPILYQDWLDFIACGDDIPNRHRVLGTIIVRSRYCIDH